MVLAVQVVLGLAVGVHLRLRGSSRLIFSPGVTVFMLSYGRVQQQHEQGKRTNTEPYGGAMNSTKVGREGPLRAISVR